MDISIQKALHDKLYDRRKGGALELEKLIRDSLAANNHDRIRKVVDQLCNDYAYAVHQPYARNGGLIGLAAASIALGTQNVAQYLEKIVPPVLACFLDQDARVRYYACESMYNIAKTSKGEILPYFNEIFDALSKLSADTEASVKNGAELLDRLVKDIVSESATSYVSLLHDSENAVEDTESDDQGPNGAVQFPAAFSLPKFIPLLQERIFVLNPFTRMFLVQWITLLDSIPDLELVSYLPSFLGGLFKFLTDSNQDVVTATQHVLERFLDEIKLVARVKRQLSAEQKGDADDDTEVSPGGPGSDKSTEGVTDGDGGTKEQHEDRRSSQTLRDDDDDQSEQEDGAIAQKMFREDWVPGQDVQIDHPKILDILVTFLRDSSEEHLQLTALRWIDSFFDICPEDILPVVPRLLNKVLPALSSETDLVRQAGTRVNNSLMEYIMSLDDEELPDTSANNAQGLAQRAGAETIAAEKSKSPRPSDQTQDGAERTQTPPQTATQPDPSTDSRPTRTIDYQGAVNALTLEFLNEHEATRVAALSWLIMLQRKAPRKVLAAHDGTFPALLKTLSDTSDTVVTRDLQLLSEISKNSDDSYFTFFMVNLLKLFCTDRKLLETRGNLIIRQLCLNLSPERIYRTMADCLEKDEDVEFASIMVQNLNNNLITAPELADLRKKLRSWDSRVRRFSLTDQRNTENTETPQDGQALFVALFKSWCNNAVATISLCLLAQAYEQAYSILQIFADIEMTVNMLIQIDKLVQLLESPVFTYLRLQLLEPDRYPALYKCLYGILMLLPQSAAFAALKNRLNSVSAIGYLHIPTNVGGPRASVGTASQASQQGSNANVPGFDRPNRLKPREDGPVKWSELLDKFRSTQDKARRWTRIAQLDKSSPEALAAGDETAASAGVAGAKKLLPPLPGSNAVPAAPNAESSGGRPGALTPGGASVASAASAQGKEHGHKSKFSVGRFASGVKGKGAKK